MFILTSQDGQSTGILGANSIMHVLPIPTLEEGKAPTYGLLVNGIPFGQFKTQEAAMATVEEVTARLALILGQGTNSGAEPQYRVPTDGDTKEGA